MKNRVFFNFAIYRTWENTLNSKAILKKMMKAKSCQVKLETFSVYEVVVWFPNK